MNIRFGGFTLLESLLVVALISILAGIVILLVSSDERTIDAHNAQRHVDVTTLVDAVHHYMLDHDGKFPSGMSDVPTEICFVGSECEGLVDFSDLFETGDYLTTLPIDPTGASENGVGYEVAVTTDGNIIVSAPHAEEGELISVTR